MNLPYEFQTPQESGLTSDHTPFVLQGIPTGQIAKIDTKGIAHLPYVMDGLRHSKCDTIDKVEPEILRLSAIFLARIMMRMASSENVPGRRRTREETKQIIREKGLNEPIAALGNGKPETPNYLNETLDYLIDHGVFWEDHTDGYQQTTC